MRSMTKSPIRLAQTALKTARASLALYSCPKSPRRYTQHQLFACLVLKEFLKLDLRGFVQLLAEWSDLRQTLNLRQIPNYSTLCYAEKRLIKKGVLKSLSA